MIRIAVVDDEKDVLELISRRIITLIEKLDYSAKVDGFTSGKDFLDSNTVHEYDIVFLDLDMPYLNGMQTAQKIRDFSLNEIIVIVTNRDDLVFDTFQYDVSGFIRKQHIENEIESVLVRVFNKAQSKDSEYLFKSNYGDILIKTEEIVYADVQNHDLYLHTSSGKQFKLFYTMEKFCNILSDESFVRCHSGFVIGLHYIFDISKDCVELINGIKIPLSRGRKDEVKMKFQRFMRSA